MKIKILLPILSVAPLAATTAVVCGCQKTTDVVGSTNIQFSSDNAFSLSLQDNQKNWSGVGEEGKDWKLEYKKADGTWDIWKDGSTKVDAIKSGSKYNLCLRGTGINTFTNTSDPENLLTTTFVFSSEETSTLCVNCDGDIRTLLNYQDVSKAVMGDYCFCRLFHECNTIATLPKLPSQVVSIGCYKEMFEGCNGITLPSDYRLPATKHIENGEIKEGLAISCYDSMFFGCRNITTIPAGLLPATKLADYCYSGMFDSCSNLLAIPDCLLPATSLEAYCYNNMFASCNAITKLPERLLPANELADHCYDGMFSVCEGLTSLPSTLLQSERLAPGCYMNMFTGCHNLKTLPNDLLLATTMFDDCYYGMFSYSGLTEIPVGLLPSNDLAPHCYQAMFQGCTGLTELKPGILPATALVTGCYMSMFDSCTNLKKLDAGLFPTKTVLAERCYQQMFQECSGLVELDEKLLPFTTLADGCYYTMFSECRSLTKVPSLPATTLNDGCYSHMFYNCNSLKVRQNGEGTKIFTCPDITGLEDPVTNMFAFDDGEEGGGEFKKTPTAGNTYNYYQ